MLAFVKSVCSISVPKAHDFLGLKSFCYFKACDKLKINTFKREEKGSVPLPFITVL